jgi:hypothetical protein
MPFLAPVSSNTTFFLFLLYFHSLRFPDLSPLLSSPLLSSPLLSSPLGSFFILSYTNITPFIYVLAFNTLSISLILFFLFLISVFRPLSFFPSIHIPSFLCLFLFPYILFFTPPTFPALLINSSFGNFSFPVSFSFYFFSLSHRKMENVLLFNPKQQQNQLLASNTISSSPPSSSTAIVPYTGIGNSGGGGVMIKSG